MRARGAVCVVPEHRLSLQLKWHEVRLRAEASEEEEEEDEASLVELLPALDSLPYCDLLDGLTYSEQLDSALAGAACSAHRRSRVH